MAAAAMPSKKMLQKVPGWEPRNVDAQYENMSAGKMSKRGNCTDSLARTCHHTNLIVHGGT